MGRHLCVSVFLSLLLACGSDAPGNGGADPGTPSVDEGAPSVDPGAPADEGAPSVDPGAPADEGAPSVDPGAPADEGAPAVDEGTPAVDEGTPPVDEGTPAVDEGTPAVDEGTPAVDEGTLVLDEGTPAVDEGSPAVDEGSPLLDEGAAADVGSGPADPVVAGCSDGTREGFLIFGLYVDLAACGGAWDEPGIHHPGPACDRQAGNTGTNPDGVGCNVEDLCALGWHVCLGAADVHQRSEAGCDGIMEGAQSPAFFVARTSSIGSFFCAPDTIGEPESENDLFGCGDLGCPTKQFVCEGNLTQFNQTKCDPDDPTACGANGPCIEGPCNPLTLGSHDLCKSITNKPGCNCHFLGELPTTDPDYVEGDMVNVKCLPGSGGCGWCKPLNYWSKFLGETFEDAWDCGSDTTLEANYVVKTSPDRQGGVLCCRDLLE